MHLIANHFSRLSKEAPPQVSQNALRGRKTAPVKLIRRFVSCLCAVGVLGSVLVVYPAVTSAQAAPQYIPPPLGSQPGRNNDTAFRKMTERMAKQRNTERQKKIEADTAKLLAMAQKLNEEVSHSNKNELSIDVVKQAGEIEKLAKSIKDKMRDGY